MALTWGDIGIIVGSGVVGAGTLGVFNYVSKKTGTSLADVASTVAPYLLAATIGAVALPSCGKAGSWLMTPSVPVGTLAPEPTPVTSIPAGMKQFGFDLFEDKSGVHLALPVLNNAGEFGITPNSTPLKKGYFTEMSFNDSDGEFEYKTNDGETGRVFIGPSGRSIRPNIQYRIQSGSSVDTAVLDYAPNQRVRNFIRDHERKSKAEALNVEATFIDATDTVSSKYVIRAFDPHAAFSFTAELRDFTNVRLDALGDRYLQVTRCNGRMTKEDPCSVIWPARFERDETGKITGIMYSGCRFGEGWMGPISDVPLQLIVADISR